MARPVIRVINPNSNTIVTDGLATALAPLALPGAPVIDCVTLAEGPLGIESQADVERVTLPLRARVAGDTEAAAFVIACYSDPGLHVCREATKKPVFGIAECGLLTAMARGDRIGVIAIKSVSIKRHLRHARMIGVIDRLVGERALEMSVAETASGEHTFGRMVEKGRALIGDGADVVVMGCAGMARHRAPLEAELGVPVIDPTQAAVAMAMATVAFA